VPGRSGKQRRRRRQASQCASDPPRPLPERWAEHRAGRRGLPPAPPSSKSRRGAPSSARPDRCPTQAERLSRHPRIHQERRKSSRARRGRTRSWSRFTPACATSCPTLLRLGAAGLTSVAVIDRRRTGAGLRHGARRDPSGSWRRPRRRPPSEGRDSVLSLERRGALPAAARRGARAAD